MDFNSIFAEIRSEFGSVLEELQNELQDVEDGSAYVLKSTILGGTEEPTDDIGNDGDIYYYYLE